MGSDRAGPSLVVTLRDLDLGRLDVLGVQAFWARPSGHRQRGCATVRGTDHTRLS